MAEGASLEAGSTCAEEVLLGVAEGVLVADADEAVDDDKQAAAVLAAADHLPVAVHAQLAMPQHHLLTNAA